MEPNLTHYLSVKDHSVSGETFELWRDDSLDMLVTLPKPQPEQLGRYYESEDYISHTDAKRSLFEKAYHVVKSIALQNKLSLINALGKSKGRLLDIGAGTGEFLLTAKKNGWDVVGIEPNAKAKNTAIAKGAQFVNAESDLDDGDFDIISMWHVLEHVPDVERQISDLSRLVKPNGAVVIAVPNFKSFDAAYYGEYWAAFDVPRHLTHFSKTAVKGLFETQEFRLEKILPMKFDAFYVSLLSEKYKTGSMNFFKAFLIGLRSNRHAKRNFEFSSHIYVFRSTKKQN
ncbi:MAG: methyltransferase [Flavobacterium sp. BFFFF1]|uniref:class I SAM-dependent methyltransferase n=1 Tax=Flavobacterium sp. BFFFF1 TaxID=2015557 RepID=UPI000BD3A46E|nr:class I SAM-dependent methyltransferase [Flavobacterium sp. BFFFF1]OYU81363.1 MAG: methyltransferase [Flavobacterium sp. BFFFF1]